MVFVVVLVVVVVVVVVVFWSVSALSVCDDDDTADHVPVVIVVVVVIICRYHFRSPVVAMGLVRVLDVVSVARHCRQSSSWFVLWVPLFLCLAATSALQLPPPLQSGARIMASSSSTGAVVPHPPDHPPPAEPPPSSSSKKVFDASLGHPLFWTERKTPKQWEELLKALNAANLFDVTPG